MLFDLAYENLAYEIAISLLMLLLISTTMVQKRGERVNLAWESDQHRLKTAT
jgi:hypothetical protein